MSQDTNTPAVETTETTADQPQIVPINYNGVEILTCVSRLEKGKNAGQEFAIPQLDTEAPSLDEMFGTLEKAVGRENLRRVLFHAIREIALDASAEARVEGQITDTAYAVAFIHGFLPASRRPGGPNKKDLEQKILSLMEQITPLTKKQFELGQALTQDEQLRMANLFLEVADLQEKLASRTTRKGKKGSKEEAVAA